MTTATTQLIIVPRYGCDLPSRFARSLAIGQRHNRYVLPHPEQPAHPHGTSVHRILRQLGGVGQLHEPVRTLTPAMYRSLSEALSLAHQRRQPLHLIAILDDHSPFGTRAAGESVIRHLRQSGRPVYLHLGAWHPTPRNLRYGLREYQTLLDESVKLASLFPLSNLFDVPGSKRYIDGIFRSSKQSLDDVVYPLHRPYYFVEGEENQQPVFLVANHQLHGLPSLHDALTLAEATTVYLPEVFSHAKDISQALAKHQHVMVLTNRPDYQEAYLGSSLTHPYLETLWSKTADEVLELMLAPQVDTIAPKHRIILLHDEGSRKSDHLLASVIKQSHGSRYACYFIQPHCFDGNSVFTNQSLGSLPHTTYEALRWYS